MKRKMLSVLLALCMALALLPGTAMAADSGQIRPKAANAIRYIDRVELPDYAITLYETLEEAADGDGYHDYLIDDEYFDFSGNLDSSFGGEPGEFKRVKFSSGNYAFIMVTSTDASVTGEEKDYIYDCIRTACAAFRADHPEVFWLGAPGYTSYTWNGKTYFICTLTHTSQNQTISEIRLSEFRANGSLDVREAMAKRDADIEKILRTIPAGADRFTQVYYLNKWLTENNEYNTAAADGLINDTLDDKLGVIPWDWKQCVNALAGKEGAAGPVCSSYARAFQVLCDKLGIPCVIVSTRSHMWNYVQMEDGKWYAVDTTWNDHSVNSANGGVGKLSGFESTDYLLVGGKTKIKGTEFLANHPAQNTSPQDVISDAILYFPEGPALNDTAYPRNVHLAYDGMPGTLSSGDSVSMTPVLLYGSDTSYTYSSTNLPAGLTLDPKTGKITGKITDASKAASVTVTATSSKDTAKCTLKFPKAAGSETAAMTFTDVPDWCAEAVGWAVSEGITNGTGNGKFTPDNPCTNNEILTFLWRAAGKPTAKSASPFSVASWYQEAIDWAYEKGMINGSFVPDAACTRAGALKFIWQALGSQSASGGGFADVPANADYAAAVSWGVSNGITNGYGTEFRPGNSCSRAEIVTFLHRAYVPSARLKP